MRIASTIGTTIEWYDFFLYGTAAALVFPAVFFPGSSPLAGTLESFATQFVGFAARPVGAAIFGHYGDRVGRKATLITTLMLMGVATFLIGCLPTYADIGIMAPVLLVVLRLLQGLAVGGEWGGATTIAIEHAPVQQRARYAALVQVGSPVGTLMSSVQRSPSPSPHGRAWGWPRRRSSSCSTSAPASARSCWGSSSP